jgi:hypothetical protein
MKCGDKVNALDLSRYFAKVTGELFADSIQ